MLVGALLGGATGLALAAVLFLGEKALGIPFLPFHLFEWLVRLLPGGLVTSAIDAMVTVIRGLKLGETSEVAKAMEQAMAIGLVVAVGVLFGATLGRLLKDGPWRGPELGGVGGLILFLPAVALEMERGPGASPVSLLGMALLIVGWGVILGASVEAVVRRRSTVADEQYSPKRRALLAKISGSALAVALASWGLGGLLQQERRATGAGRPLSRAAPTPSPGSTASEPGGRRIEPAPGTRPEITPNEDFYRIDISLRPPMTHEDSWTLDVRGLFDNPRRLTLAELMSFPAVTQPITLSCISNPVGGDLIGASYWTGVPLMALLKELGLRPEARELVVRAADGFFESVTMADLQDPRVLLVYGANGETLAAEHGFPLRIYIPNRYGMKQPKWITGIEAIDREGPGYWVERGWSQEARPHIVSIIDSVATDGIVNGRVPVGGIAWAGDRGIVTVEMQVDNGPWETAVLRTPPLSPLIWVQWRHDWPASPGRHTFRVRATDGSGALQVEQRSVPHPDGATGYHEVTSSIPRLVHG